MGARVADTSTTAGARRHRQQPVFFGAKRCLEGKKSSQENSWKKTGNKKVNPHGAETHFKRGRRK